MTIENLSDTTKAKSEQLNADDLHGGPIDVLITGIRRGSADQPIIIDIADHMPFKPCKTVRRILIKGWGDNGHEWVGKSLKVYNDPAVKWAGVAIGGVRVSHMSHISEAFEISLAASSKKKVLHRIEVLEFSEIVVKFNSIQDDAERGFLWASLSAPQKAAVNESLTNGAK